MNAAKVYRMTTPMQKQQDPLNLQSLPLVSPPDDLWSAIEAGLRRRQARRTALYRAFGGLAAAAAVVLAFGLVLRQPPAGPAVQPEPVASTATPQPQLAAETDETTAAERVEALIQLSQRLERRLRHVRSEVGGLTAQAVVYQVELEDLVVQVDEELSRTPDSVSLWSQRVALLLDLERLYESGLRREYRHMASL